VDPEHDDETTSPPTRLQRTYLPALRFALGHRVLTMALALLVFGGTLALAPRLKTDFIGNAGETSLRVTQELPSGTNLATTDAAAKKVETVLAGEAQVESYQTTVGGDPSQLLFGTATASNNASMSVTLKPGANGDQVRERLRREFATLTGVGAVEIGAVGSANQVVLYVESADSQKLRAGSDQVVAMLKRIGGVSNISSDLTDAKKQLSVQIDEQAAADAGMLQAQVGVAVSQAVKGSKIGTLESGGATVNVILRSRAAVATLAQLKALELPVSMKQSIDARKAAADRVEARQTAAQERQRADGVTAYQAQLDQIREGKKRAQAQSAELAKQLAALRARLAALNAAPAPPPGTPAPTPTTPDPRPALLAQIAELQKAIGAAQGQVRAADDSLAKAAESRQKQLGYQAEAEDIQQAAKDAQTTKATPLTLAEVAKVEEIAAPSSIGRVDGARAATITGLPSGSDLGSTTSNITRGIASLSLPEGVTVRVGGVSQAQQESFAQLGLAMLIAIAIVYLIMVATFGSLLQPLILLVSVPFAATGALGLLLATNTPLGVPAMIGLLMLIGIVVTNAIVLIDLINQYRRRGASIDDAIRQGARLRLRPIVMTALATVFALAPMGLGVTGGGIFISRPLAIVVIGGLVTSTVLTLVLVPVLYDVVEKLRSRGADRRAQRGQRPRGPVAAAADLD
jgi:HAE1 family hydrophobic/amphiphilic exporter-1